MDDPAGDRTVFPIAACHSGLELSERSGEGRRILAPAHDQHETIRQVEVKPIVGSCPLMDRPERFGNLAVRMNSLCGVRDPELYQLPRLG